MEILPPVNPVPGFLLDFGSGLSGLRIYQLGLK